MVYNVYIKIYMGVQSEKMCRINERNGDVTMKIAKAAVCAALFTAAMVYGCRALYKVDGEEQGDVFAEGSPVTEDTTSVPEENIPDMTEVTLSADKEISLTRGKTVTFSFIGDCLLASNAGDKRTDSFAEYAKEKPSSYFLEKAVPYYCNSDFVMANSEFVLSDRQLPKASKSGTAFWFKSPADNANILKDGQIDIVTIANNHTSDYGNKGYEDTKAALEAAGITWGDLNDPVYVEKDGIKFGIICASLFNVNYDPLITPVIEEVKSESDIQILYFHGGTENEYIPEDWLTELCHKYADMGVDLIIGTHPHVLRPMEEYNGVDIIYSLGNFCYGGNRLPENRTVILTEAFSFDENGFYISQEESFTPFYVYSGSHNNWQPAPITDPREKSKTLAFMYGGSDMPY